MDTSGDLLSFVNTLQPRVSDDATFHLRSVTFREVLCELKSIQSDTSTGADQLPAKYLKIVTEHIAESTGPLTHIIYSYIAVSSFPDTWKVANTNSITSPISILPVLSKAFERLTHH